MYLIWIKGQGCKEHRFLGKMYLEHREQGCMLEQGGSIPERTDAPLWLGQGILGTE